MVEHAEVDGAARATRRTRPVANRRGTISERLNYLFDTVHPPGRKPYSAAEVARWINENGGKISAVYILKILSGERSDPSQRYLKHLAQFFEISPAFFWDDEPPELDGAALSAAIVLRDDKTQSMLIRAAQLSPASQDALSDIIDSLLRAEGKSI